MNATALFTPHQRAIAERALAEECAQRTHLVISLSGAHAYGFPSPDSDLDLKAIHIESTAKLVGLTPPKPTFDRLEVIEGVEIDYTSNEIGPVLVGILSGNGNYLERVLGTLPVVTSPEHDELRPIVQRALSKKLFRHYAGFARGQLRDFDEAAEPTAKKLLYVIRTALTGMHALRTGRVVIDANELLDEYGFAAAAELIQQKRAGERVVLHDPLRTKWRAEVERAFGQLSDAFTTSPLPDEAPNIAELDAWLQSVRQRHW